MNKEQIEELIRELEKKSARAAGGQAIGYIDMETAPPILSAAFAKRENEVIDGCAEAILENIKDFYIGDSSTLISMELENAAERIRSLKTQTP